MTTALLVSLALLAYIYGGYLLLLRLAVWIRGQRAIKREAITPSVTLIVSAFNEAGVIRRKIENALALTYPAGKLDIVVISDASDDGTDAIVREYESRGVRLARQQERRGKTAGLNAVVPLLSTEILVFSDANAMYDSEALLKLVRNFADPEVGCVTGEARYIASGVAAADVGERLYWNYEMHVKRLETALGSMVGGDGAIYAIRCQLFQPLPDNAINDFLNPLQVVAAGWRAVYEPEAVCYEETAGAVHLEYRRRIRIVSRSWRAIFQEPSVLNPFKVGLFAWEVVSHKILRWLSAAFAAVAIVGLAGLYVNLLTRWPAATVVTTLVAVTTGWATRKGRSATAVLAYFAAITVASVWGLVKGTLGRVSGVWTTPREEAATPASARLVPVGQSMQAAAAIVVVAAIAVFRSVPLTRFAGIVFWTAGVALVYVYIGYPLLLAVLRRFFGQSVRRGPCEPRVCVFIAANDEAAVIEAKIRNTLALDYPKDRLEALVASDGSVDNTNEIVRRYEPRVRLLALTPRRGKMAAINEGMKAVTSEIVVFSDANTFLEPGAIRALVRNFADDQVGAVSGDVTLVGERAALARSEDLYYNYERWVQRAESELGSMIGADGALYAIRRSMFVPPPADTILDDMAIPMAVVRGGRRVIFDGDARAVEQGSETATEEFSRKTRVIAGAMQFIGRHDSAIPLSAPQVILSFISHKGLRWLSPVFAVCLLCSSLLLAPNSIVGATAVVCQLTLLAVGLAGCIPALRRFAPIAIAYYFCLLQAAAAVGFIRGLTGRQSVLWQRFGRVTREERVSLS